MKKIILTLLIATALFGESITVTEDTKIVLDCKAMTTTELNDVQVIQNRGNRDVLYSITPFSDTNIGFILSSREILILSSPKKLYARCLSKLSNATIMVSAGGY